MVKDIRGGVFISKLLKFHYDILMEHFSKGDEP
jgi:hypothetical protein